MGECDGKGGQGEDEQTDEVDEAEDEDGVVFAQILIGDNGTQDRSD